MEWSVKLVSIVLLATLSCTTVPFDPTIDKRNALRYAGIDFVHSKHFFYPSSHGGTFPESPWTEKYLEHFDLDESIENSNLHSFYLGYLSLNDPSEDWVSMCVFLNKDHESPLVVLIPGFLGTVKLFRDTVPDFLDLGFSVIIVDLPGHGFSSGVRGGIDDFRDYGNFLAQLLEWRTQQEFFSGPLFLLGHSTGASAILQYLIQGHEPIAGIIFVNPLVRHSFWHLGQFGGWMLSLFTKYQSPLFTPDSLVGPWYYPIDWVMRLGYWNETLPQKLENPPPLLIHQGGNDGVVDFGYNIPRLEQLFPLAQIHMVDGLGHTALANRSQSHLILDRIIAFINSYQ